MATGEDNNDVEGDGTTGSEVDDDGNGVTGDNNDDDDDGNDNDDGDGRRRRRPKMTTMATARRATRSKMMATARRATALWDTMTMMTARWATKLTTGKTEVIGQGTAPVLVPMTSVFFGLFSHT